MIRLRVDDASLNTLRLTFSPLWETIGSLGILACYRGDAPSPYRSWVTAVRSGMPRELTVELVETMRESGSRLFPPGFVPVPDPSRNTIDAELACLRERNPGDAHTDWIVPLLGRYWDHAIAPYWNSIRASLEEEILFRGRTLAVEGPEAMLGELCGRVLWSRPDLTAPYHRDMTVPVTDSRIRLVPTVFAGGLRLFVEERTRWPWRTSRRPPAGSTY